MKDPLIDYEPGKNFWTLPYHGQLKDVLPFSQKYRADKTPNHTESSTFMWWVLRATHLSPANVLREKLEVVRWQEVSLALYHDAKWHEGDEQKAYLQPFIDKWDRIGKSTLQIQVEMKRAQMEKRDQYYNAQVYGNGNASNLDRAELDREKMILSLEALEKKLFGEFEVENTDPDASASEAHLI